MEYLLGYAVIGLLAGAAICYVAPSEERALHFLVGLLAWPIIALALLAEYFDARRARPEKLPVPRAGWPRRRRTQ